MTCVVGCSRFSVCMRLTSLLVPMPTLMMSSNNPVHRNLKSAVQIVAMSTRAPRVARILAVMVLVLRVEVFDEFDSLAFVFAQVFVVVPDVVGAVGGCLCVVVAEVPFAVVDDSGGFVFGFWFEEFAEEAFHRGSCSYGFWLCPLMSAVSWPSCQNDAIADRMAGSHSGSSDSHSGYPATSWRLFTRLSSCAVSGWVLSVVSFGYATRAAWWGFGVVGLRSRASSGGGGWWLGGVWCGCILRCGT